MWQPCIQKTSSTHLYRQIVDCLASDIRSGTLRKGQRLPTVRSLADALGVTAGTINKAYADAAERGLVVKTQGKGTFVSGTKPTKMPLPTMVSGAPTSYDFTINQPAEMDLQSYFAPHLASLAKTGDNQMWSCYRDTIGEPAHRESIASWLNTRGAQCHMDDVFLINGAQQGMMSALMLLCGKGDTVMVQASTFPGEKALLDILGLKLQVVEVDNNGLDLASFEAACKASLSKVLILLPTAHNPTGITMSLSHRQALVDIARRHGVFILEDDLYLHHEPVVALQQLAPERTFHISGFSKCVSPGLRMGTLIAPAEFKLSLTRIIQAQNWMTSPIITTLAHQLLLAGDVDKIVAKRQIENQKRLAIAKDYLKDYRLAYDPVNIHIWLKHSPTANNAEIISRLHSRNVEVLPSAFFYCDGRTTPHIRLCLGNLALDRMIEGLALIQQELKVSVMERAII